MHNIESLASAVGSGSAFACSRILVVETPPALVLNTTHLFHLLRSPQKNRMSSNRTSSRPRTGKKRVCAQISLTLCPSPLPVRACCCCGADADLYSTPLVRLLCPAEAFPPLLLWSRSTCQHPASTASARTASFPSSHLLLPLFHPCPAVRIVKKVNHIMASRPSEVRVKFELQQQHLQESRRR